MIEEAIRRFLGCELHEVSTLEKLGPCSSDQEFPVTLHVDGRIYLAGFLLSRSEHNRRRNHGLGAVTSTGLLHALWELPNGLAFPNSSLREIDRHTLGRQGHGWIEQRNDDVIRKYQPPGTVSSIFVADRSLARAINKAAIHPDTVMRTAIWVNQPQGGTKRQSEMLLGANELGVGVLQVGTGYLRQLVQPANPKLGRPSVFRWWHAELAYRNWLSKGAPTARAESLA